MLNNWFSENLATKSNDRLMSIDALRGFDMLWIIGGERLIHSIHQCVQSPITEKLSTQMNHVEWLGFHFYDIIMPLFMFIVGVSMAFSIPKRIANGESKRSIYKHIAIRVAILWVFGMILQGNLLHYNFYEIKFFSNTLQAIAVGYLISAILIMETKYNTQLLFGIGFMLFFWLIMAAVGNNNYSQDGNIAIIIDKAILGTHQDGTYYSWILSSLTFATTTLMGVFAGYILRTSVKQWHKVILLTSISLISIDLALVLDLNHPIIKHLWTSSFVLYAGGLCFLFLAIFYTLIDVLKLRKPAFFMVVIGSNAIAVYMVAHLFDFRLITDIFTNGIAQYISDDAYQIIRNICSLSLIYYIMYLMYKKKMFFKI